MQPEDVDAVPFVSGAIEEPAPELAVEQFSDDEDEELDTTAEQYRAGKDLQGIPWDRLQFSRPHYREARLKSYRNYTNVLPEDTTSEQYVKQKSEILQSCKTARKDGQFFDFVRNYRAVQSNIVHFQLRNLVWALSRNDVFVVHENCVNHWNPATRRLTEVVNLAGMPRGPRVPGVGKVQISTLCVKEGIIAAGGFSGELVVKRLDCPTMAFSGRLTHSENGITNGIEVFNDVQHGTCIMASNNDAMVRLYNVETFRSISRFPYPWAVNFATLRPEGHIAAVVGDDPVTQLTDINSGVTVAQLGAHKDYSFAAAWHPNGNMLATGNQDATAVVWDIRCTAAPLARLPGRLGAIRSLRFSADGRFLAMAEPADFVHVYDVQTGFEQCQEIDLFGEISGVSFTPMADAFFVGISDITYSSLVQFERIHHSSRTGTMTHSTA